MISLHYPGFLGPFFFLSLCSFLFSFFSYGTFLDTFVLVLFFFLLLLVFWICYAAYRGLMDIPEWQLSLACDSIANKYSTNSFRNQILSLQ